MFPQDESELDHLFARFTPRETQVAAMLREGRSNREIAAELVVSPDTVKHHVGRVLRKLGASNRADAAAILSGR
jgi:DNA-binding NarL/FixJ family response regulator